MKFRFRREAAHTGLLFLVAVAALIALVTQTQRIRNLHKDAMPPADRQLSPEDWLTMQSEGTRVGSGNAPLQILYFSDFQCPACRTMHHRLDTLAVRYGEHLAVTIVHFPIESLHPHARAAAVASECAAEQDRFAEYGRVLFQAQKQIGSTSWEDFARRAGVRDADAFRSCLADDPARARVAVHESIARRLGIGETPTVVINGLVFGAPPSTDRLEIIAENVLRSARALSPTASTTHQRASKAKA